MREIERRIRRMEQLLEERTEADRFYPHSVPIIEEATPELAEAKMEEYRQQWLAQGWDGEVRGRLLFIVVERSLEEKTSRRIAGGR